MILSYCEFQKWWIYSFCLVTMSDMLNEALVFPWSSTKFTILKSKKCFNDVFHWFQSLLMEAFFNSRSLCGDLGSRKKLGSLHLCCSDCFFVDGAIIVKPRREIELQMRIPQVQFYWTQAMFYAPGDVVLSYLSISTLVGICLLSTFYDISNMHNVSKQMTCLSLYALSKHLWSIMESIRRSIFQLLLYPATLI